jgi:hypothetical protein
MMLKVALCPLASVIGSVKLLTEKPAPVTLACETVTDEAPVLVTVSYKLLLLPTWTLPKERLPGLDASVPGTTPVPENGILRFAFVALDVTVRLPLVVPAVDGLKERMKGALWPALRVKGSVSPLNVKPLPAAALEIVTLAAPELVRAPFIVFDVPVCMLPKLNAVGFEAN